MGYYLAQQNENFVILDGKARTGDAWRNRWETLRLFTPSQFDSLPRKQFPQPENYFPSKDEVADYLEEYARQFQLPIRNGMKVRELRTNGQVFTSLPALPVLRPGT